MSTLSTMRQYNMNWNSLQRKVDYFRIYLAIYSLKHDFYPTFGTSGVAENFYKILIQDIYWHLHILQGMVPSLKNNALVLKTTLSIRRNFSKFGLFWGDQKVLTLPFFEFFLNDQQYKAGISGNHFFPFVFLLYLYTSITQNFDGKCDLIKLFIN